MDLATDLLSSSERQQLIQAMSELCAIQGYEETSAEQVAARARLPVESFEEHFGTSKAECAHAALTAILGEFISTASGAYSPDRPEWESLMLATKALLELMAANPSYAHLRYITARQMSEDPKLREAYRSATQVPSVLLTRGWEYSSSEVQPPSAARAALGAAEAVIRRELVAGRGEQLPRALPDFIYIATVSFLGQDEALRHAERAREMLRGTAWE